MTDHLTVIPAVYVFLERDGKYLFMRRCNTGYQDGNYQVPSGHVDPNESPSEAIIREAEEEVGIHIEPADLTFVHVAYRMNEEKTGYRVDFFFTASIWKGEIRNAEPEKCTNLEWFSPDALPENIVPLMRTVLKEIRQGSYLSEVTQ